MTNLIHNLLIWLADLGYLGIALGLMVEIIPSEIVLAYGGYMISQGTIHFVGAVIAGTIGGTLAQLFIYWIGYYGGRPFIDKYGKFLLIKKHHVDKAEEWFNKYGVGVIFTARFIPVVRHAISVPAGMAKMSFWKFTLYTALAIIPWTILFLKLGEQLGKNWQEISTKAAVYTQPIALVAILVILAFIIFSMMKKKRNRTR